jgi:hypothetical protein
MVRVTYRKIERETVVLFNEAEETASVCTFNRAFIRKLMKLSRRFPEKIKQTQSTAGGKCLTFTVPKSCITIYPPHTDEWKQKAKERAMSAV